MKRIEKTWKKKLQNSKNRKQILGACVFCIKEDPKRERERREN